MSCESVLRRLIGKAAGNDKFVVRAVFVCRGYFPDTGPASRGQEDEKPGRCVSASRRRSSPT